MTAFKRRRCHFTFLSAILLTCLCCPYAALPLFQLSASCVPEHDHINVNYFEFFKHFKVDSRCINNQIIIPIFIWNIWKEIEEKYKKMRQSFNCALALVTVAPVIGAQWCISFWTKRFKTNSYLALWNFAGLWWAGEFSYCLYPYCFQKSGHKLQTR